METIKTYITRADAEIARTALEASGITAIVEGIDVGGAGYAGMGSIKLKVLREQMEAALEVLGDS